MDNTYTPAQRNSSLCRKELDFILNGNFVSYDYKPCENMQFFKINGLTKFWEKEKDFELNVLVGDILNSCIRFNIPFVYAIIGDENGINIYVGTQKTHRDSLISSYEAMFPGIDIECISENPLRTSPREYGGMFTGIPTNKMKKDSKNFQIENICRGMQGRNFTYVIVALGIGNLAVTYGYERILEEMESVYSFINQSISGGAHGNITAQHQDFNSKNYFENLEFLEQSLKNGMSRGMWRFNGYYASDDQMDSKRLGNIIKASFSGDESKPEPFRVIEYNSIKDVISGVNRMEELVEMPEIHPLGRWQRADQLSPINFYIYKYQTILNSDQMATLCQLPTKEFQGYYLDEFVEFDVSSRTKNKMNEPISIGDVCVAGRKGSITKNNQYSIEKDDFTRHALIIGVTGGGKTNTSKSLLSTLWNTDNGKERIPFMVIESAKREYWEMRNLKGFEDLLVFTLGSEASGSAVRYRINPFETTPSISLQTHIDYLLSTFKAAFDLFPPMPYILEKAVYEIYSDRGWDIVENINRYGFTEYPTLSDLYDKIDVIVDDMEYHQEIQSNVKAALQARIYSLMIGGKGAMLNTPKSVPIEELLSRPVIMELEDIGDDETKSFVIGILLVQLYEYRKSQMTKGSKKLSHILMVEEAHRLLKNVTETSESGSARAKSVEFFCNLLSEIRTFGQGIFIADQIPTRLAPDTIKNTNLKIVHRTVEALDRENIGKSMNMSQEQIEYLSSLRRGYAAVYSEGDNRPKCVKIPLIESFYEKERSAVIKEVQNKVYNIAKNYDEIVYHHAGCSYCEHRCKGFDELKWFIDEKVDVALVLKKWEENKYSAQRITKSINGTLMEKAGLKNEFENICAIGYILSKKSGLNDGQQKRIIAEYLRYKNK